MNPFDDDIFNYITADKKNMPLKQYVQLREKAIMYIYTLDRAYKVSEIARLLKTSTGTITDIRKKYQIANLRRNLALR